MKIDREKLKEALSILETADALENMPKHITFSVETGMLPVEYVRKAAQLLLEITAPDYVPREAMFDNASAVEGRVPDIPAGRIFRAMIGELCK